MPGPRPQREAAVAVAVFAVIAAVLLWRGLDIGSGRVLGSEESDCARWFYPCWQYGADMLRSRVVPLWDPNLCGGRPHLALPESQVLYPPTLLLALFLPTGTVINATIALHLVLAAVFCFLFLRDREMSIGAALLGGLVYAFSAVSVTRVYAGQICVICSMCWAPLIFRQIGRCVRGGDCQSCVGLSFVVALQLLAGQHAYVFCTVCGAGLYALFVLDVERRNSGIAWHKLTGRLACCCFACLLGGLLAAAQLLPTAELAGLSRAGSPPAEELACFSFPVQNLLTAILPDAFGDGAAVAYWGEKHVWNSTIYVGALTLLLVPLAFVPSRRRRDALFWAGLGVALLTVGLVLYPQVLVYCCTWPLVPYLLRQGCMAVTFVGLVAAVLAAHGFDAVDSAMEGKERKILLIVCLAVLSVLLVMLTSVLVLCDVDRVGALIDGLALCPQASCDPASSAEPDFAGRACELLRYGAIRGVLLLLAGAGLAVARIRGWLGTKGFAAASILLLSADLVGHGLKYTVAFDPLSVDWDVELVHFLQRDRDLSRAAAPTLSENGPTIHGIQTLSGSSSLPMDRFCRYTAFSQQHTVRTEGEGVAISHINRLTDLLNVRYVVTPSNIRVVAPGLRRVFKNGRAAVYWNASALPRAFLTPCVQVMGEEESILKRLVAPQFEPQWTALIEEKTAIDLPAQRGVTSLADFAPVHVKTYSAHKILLRAQAKRPSLLVLGDVYYPGWRAWVDGHETTILRTNHVMRGVPLQAGTHEVEFRYRPASFIMGVALSLLTAAFLILYELMRGDEHDDRPLPCPTAPGGYPPSGSGPGTEKGGRSPAAVAKASPGDQEKGHSDGVPDTKTDTTPQ